MSKTTTAVPASAQLEAEIARIAYLKSEQRGFLPGQELDDWLEAEREVTSSRTGKKPAQKKAAAKKKAAKKKAKSAG